MLPHMNQVTYKLLVAAVADPSQTVRCTVLGALLSTDSLDECLAQVCAWAHGRMGFPHGDMGVWGFPLVGRDTWYEKHLKV